MYFKPPPHTHLPLPPLVESVVVECTPYVGDIVDVVEDTKAGNTLEAEAVHKSEDSTDCTWVAGTDT